MFMNVVVYGKKLTNEFWWSKIQRNLQLEKICFILFLHFCRLIFFHENLIFFK